MSAREASWKNSARWALRAGAALYLLTMWLEGPGWTGPLKHLPSSLLFFAQCTALFPHAALASIEYRAEGYVCDESEWREVDTRPFFPIDADDKESRFQRVMFFYRHNKKTMTALDRFLVAAHNRHDRDDGEAAEQTIGGVRLFSIRTPLPPVGDLPERVHRRRLSEIPSAWRKVFYETRSEAVTSQCFGKTPKYRRSEPGGKEVPVDRDDPAGDEPRKEATPGEEPR